mmetsp:Transcript_14907/g.25975  ORF Transcript_14907/g.25975 Transcript_14907/m.25975 type:complete len:117 (+) Transcript_14907:1185-1535(+)
MSRLVCAPMSACLNRLSCEKRLHIWASFQLAFGTKPHACPEPGSKTFRASTHSFKFARSPTNKRTARQEALFSSLRRLDLLLRRQLAFLQNAAAVARLSTGRQAKGEANRQRSRNS